MKYFRGIICLILWQIIIVDGFGQVPNGSWRNHLPCIQAKRLAETENMIFCISQEGGFFSVNKRDNSMQKYSKENGLSDAGFSTIGYSQLTHTLVIGYENGNLDLMRNDSVINIPDIKRKLMVGDKTIYNVYFLDHYAYLSCGFGIVVCDLLKKEIKDSYLFGEGGSQIKVNDITSDGQFLYAATSQGIYKADYTNSNLSDYNSWTRLNFIPDYNSEYSFLAYLNNKLFSLHHNSSLDIDDVISIQSDSWEYWSKVTQDRYYYLGEHNGYMLLCTSSKTKVFDQQEQLIKDEVTYWAVYAIYSNEKTLWYADPNEGVIRTGSQGGVFAPNGPAFHNVGDIKIESGQVWAAGGTEASKWNGYGAYSFINEHWTNYNKNTIPLMENFLNIFEIAIDKNDPNHIIGGSRGYGIIEFEKGSLTHIYNETNSILKPVPGYENIPGYVLISGVDFDKEGNLWVSAMFNNDGVYVRRANGEWSTINFKGHYFNNNSYIGNILAASNGQIWILNQRAGVLVFKENTSGSLQERFFSIHNQVGDLLNQVYSLAEDKDGNIWVGTGNGPVVYYNAGTIFDDSDVIGDQPEIPRNDGTNLVDLLLSTEKITSIAVDGANRKWFATEKSGVFLVSPDGTKELLHFTAENSPLLSNNVLTVAVNDKTGEVFFGTDKGIISYRGQATDGGENFKNVYVFPNPVRENYSGDITITGLVSDVNVKITDISGNLVFETTALGGQAIWDGKNFHGERVHTGVYLVFCSNEDGSKTFVTKLLFIH